jgi:hypothetical protein
MNAGDMGGMTEADQAKLNDLINQKQMKDRCVWALYSTVFRDTGVIGFYTTREYATEV